MEDNVKNAILEIQENIDEAQKCNLTMLLVEANVKGGYKYPYILCYPNQNMSNTLVMNCLNDYEEEMSENETENSEVVEQIYSLFGENRIFSNSKLDTTEKIEEDKEKSLARLSYRIQKATNSISLLVNNFNGAPIIMPLIPGFRSGENHENISSELGAGIAQELAPQISNMIESAQEIVNLHTGVKLDDKIISFGHSKSSIFADHFTSLYPQKIKATVLGGKEYALLPIEELRLIIDDNKTANEHFTIKNNIPYKKVTQIELNKIIKEYSENKKENQKDISVNEDGSYSLPMNYPLGIADIEEYIGEFQNEQAKDEYLKSFSEIPRVIFVGEDEEKVEGHYAYLSGKTLDGKEIAAGEDLLLFGGDKEPLFEIENASMHNRVLDYISAQRTLFGKGANERLKNYMDICTKLDINIQLKIYENVGHINIYRSEALHEDLNAIYSSLIENNTIPELDDNERASRISPIYQLLRRYKVSESSQEFDAKSKKWDEFTRRNKEQDRITEHEKIIGILQKEIDDYLFQEYDLGNAEVNIDNLYDSLTTSELVDIFDRVFDNDKIQKNSTISMESVVKNAITQGIATEHIVESDEAEHRIMQASQKEGETKDE